MRRVSTSSPTCGSFELMIATSAANTGVKGKLAAWAFMTLRQNKPLPRMRFSAKSSGTTCLILAMLTRLTIPVIDLRSASHERRWYSGLALSLDAAACRARRRAGGMYTPPEREPTSLANSACASVCARVTVVMGVVSVSVFSSSMAAIRAASWRSRSARRIGSASSTFGRGMRTFEGGDWDLRRLVGGGPSMSGERDRDLQLVSF